MGSYCIFQANVQYLYKPVNWFIMQINELVSIREELVYNDYNDYNDNVIMILKGAVDFN